MNDTIGKRISERRKDLGISQDELAKQLGYKRTWLSNIETDARPLPGIDVLLHLCDVLKTTPTYILIGYEEKDATLGKELGLSGQTMKLLRTWKEMYNNELKDYGDSAFPVSKQIDFLLGVLAKSPLTIMMLYEYLSADYDRIVCIAEENKISEIPPRSIFAKDGFFTTASESFELLARAKLMDHLKTLRDNIKGGEKNGKS